MSVETLFNNFYLFAIKHWRYFCVKKGYKNDLKLLKNQNIKIKKLTKEQKKEVDKIWGKFKHYSYTMHELCYSATGEFNPYIIPEEIFRTKFELLLNNQQFKNAWADKSYFNLHFAKELFPKTIVCNINGHYYDENYKLISKENAIDLIQQQEKVVIKPTLETGFGKGVYLYEKQEDLKSLLEKYNKNFIVQEVFKQHNILSKFNASSVNIIRVCSVFINDEILILPPVLRCGEAGKFNDNYISKDGKGMLFVGISNDGKIKNNAYYFCGLSMSIFPNEEKFAGIKIPGFEKIESIVKTLHSKLGHFGYIAWDFIIDENGNPKIMEYNIKGPGILTAQYANGPLFGEHTKKIIDWFNNYE